MVFTGYTYNSYTLLVTSPDDMDMRAVSHAVERCMRSVPKINPNKYMMQGLELSL